LQPNLLYFATSDGFCNKTRCIMRGDSVAFCNMASRRNVAFCNAY
jgi:hypothetical protein